MNSTKEYIFTCTICSTFIQHPDETFSRKLIAQKYQKFAETYPEQKKSMSYLERKKLFYIQFKMKQKKIPSKYLQISTFF